MAAKRTPLGFTIEQHREMAEALRMIGKHLLRDAPDRSRAGAARARVGALLVTLTGELDSFYFLDCKALAIGDVPRMYYGLEPSGNMEHYSFLQTRDDLEDIRQRLVHNKSAAKAVKCIDAMIAKMNLAGLY